MTETIIGSAAWIKSNYFILINKAIFTAKRHHYQPTHKIFICLNINKLQNMMNWYLNVMLNTDVIGGVNQHSGTCCLEVRLGNKLLIDIEFWGCSVSNSRIGLQLGLCQARLHSLARANCHHLLPALNLAPLGLSILDKLPF
jgi:hypothetical protein